MTATEFVALLRQAGWSYSHLAGRLGYSKAAIGTMADGRNQVPAPVARYLLAIVRAIERVPRPDRTKPHE